MAIVEGRSDAEVATRAGIRVRVRLRRELLRTSMVSLGAAMVPLTAALCAIAAAHNSRWPVLLAVELFILLSCLAIVLRRRVVYAEVTETVLRGNGIASPMEEVALDRIAAVHLVPTYVLGTDEAVYQLLATDAAGCRVFRMRGTYWENGDLERVAAALPVRAHVVREPIRLAEFWARYPTSEYWFENKPLVQVLIVLGVCAASVVLAITVMGIG